MPVGFLDRRTPRIPRLGVIHLGVKAKTQSGKEYPQKVDYFAVHEDDHTSAEAVEAFRKAYGEKPRELDILIPAEDEQLWMPTDLKAYKSGVGLWCKGPGQNDDDTPGLAVRVYDPEDRTLDGLAIPQGTRPGAMISVPLCHTETCPLYQSKKCRLISRMQFMLPEVSGLGCWQLTTSSFNSVQNVRGGVAFIRSFTAGRIAGIPLKLRLTPQKSTADGQAVTIYVLQLANEHVRLADVLAASRKTWEQVLALPEPGDYDDEIPADHFPAEADAQRTIDAEVASPPAPATPAAPPEAAAPDAAPEAPAAPPAAKGRSLPLADLEDEMEAAGWFPAKRKAKLGAWEAQGLDAAGMLAAFRAEVEGGQAPADPPDTPPPAAPPERKAPPAPTPPKTTRRAAPPVGSPADPQAPPPARGAGSQGQPKKTAFFGVDR